MVNQQFAFAVHIMTLLAFADEVIGSEKLAASVRTNPVVVRRLLQALRRAKLIRTYAGKNGGARLLVPPKRVTLLAIYDAIEPRPVIPLSEHRAAKHCRVSCNMERLMTSVATGAEKAMRQHLRRISLADLVRRIES